MKNYLLPAFLSALALFFISCAMPSTFQGDDNVITESMKAVSVHEDCMKVMPGQKIVYAFEVSMPVHFNLHYHVDSEMEYPIIEKAVSKGENTYTAEIEQYYCLMWTNPHHAEATLRYTCTVTD
ncbi:MAG: hypothetical protein GWN86_18410 [Desulfobacterales bacterium]|nr:hypothetical protein [Desulfobacterales bacterium]